MKIEAIDLHTHGSSGFDFAICTSGEMELIIQDKINQGYSKIVPTISSRKISDYPKIVSNLNRVISSEYGRYIAGVYFEGPFLNITKRGAHKLNHVKLASRDNLSKFVDAICDVDQAVPIIIAFAPELPNAAKLVGFIKKQRSNAIFSYGHTAASEKEAYKLADIVSLVTHLFNAMPPIHHRRNGFFSWLVNSRCFVEIIPDGVHLNKLALRIAKELIGVDRLIAVTDSIFACGLRNGNYKYDGMHYMVNKGITTMKDGTLAGSTASLSDIINTLRENNFTDSEIEQILVTNPKKLLKSVL